MQGQYNKVRPKLKYNEAKLNLKGLYKHGIKRTLYKHR
jgi:hypothetical protein